MKTNWFFVIVLLVGYSAMAQTPAPAGGEGGARHERVEALRVAYITNQLQLSPEEAQRFWPVYNQFHHDLRTLRQNFGGKGADLTADQQLEFEQKKLDLKKRYKPQFEQCIGKEKVNRLARTEENFKRDLVRVLRERREGGPRMR
ncbi:MAG: hypothetical protein U0T84_12975 [Chitinophagales bacterium]